jgi:hypothetical protein
MSFFSRSFFTISKAAFSTATSPAGIVTLEQQIPVPTRVFIPKSFNLRGSRKRLIQHGLNALLPTAELKHPESYVAENKNSINLASLPGSERSWKPPALSKRKAAVLRKEAIRNGTYGKFDSEKGGVGWDPMWDVELAKVNLGGLGRYTALRVPKKSSRKRTREMRAQKIETAMIGMDERMEEVQAAKHRNKPPVTFESTYKELMKVKK